MPQINDLNLQEWKQYDDILTDSLWLLGKRDKSGAHNNAYHGNFIPQIPNQLMRRFTRQGDVVLDLFLGSGTTLIEAKRLGRHAIGVELLDEVAQSAQRNIASEGTPEDVCADAPDSSANNTSHKSHLDTLTDIIVGDSTRKTTRNKVVKSLTKTGKDKVHLIILHPPYHDIIKFSDEADDLSNSPSVEDFTKKFGDIIAHYYDLLEKDRHLAIIIGDKYTNSEWVPLGFHLMQETLKRADKLILKSIVVKNMANNRAKLNQENLWRYRALAGGFYIFKHEYILLFRKGV